MFILIAGTSGSGKSLRAEERLSEFNSSNKIYIATAKIYDDEMSARVKKHQAMRRNKGFITIERPLDLGAIEIPEDSSVLVEALTTWLANEMFEGVGDSAAEKILADVHSLKAKSKNLILVADDIFSDGVVYDELTERYRKTLAGLMITFAAEADEAIECVAGVYTQLKE
ncbi:MAG: bifunctional adenosylcobinamide kinase/adenosylcobinamide-phosphate guanylyltransferase [Synergistaceae bacterium]|nr:bifunctional adenosylcobinamide kinase/adenosylcobinamide-phosphate guanylyltransferase [Synergistaceae bacterium]